jgi:hypothetical protein
MLRGDIFFILKKKVFVYIIIIFLSILSLFSVPDAQEYGISGEVSLIYSKDEIKSGATTTELSSLEHGYTLNYSNYVYRPRLLSYFLSGNFSKQDGEINDADTQAKSKGFDIRLDFLRGTPYPLTFWMSKQKPTSFALRAYGGAVFIEQKSKSFGFDGGLFFPKLPIFKYNYREEDKKTITQTQITHERERNLFLDLSQTWQNSRFDVDYEYRGVLDKITLSEEKNHNFRMIGSIFRDLSRVSKIQANAEFHRETLSDITEMNIGTLFNYFPTQRFQGRANVSFSHKVQVDESGNNFLTAVYSNYRLSSALTLIGNSSFNYNSGIFGDNTTEDLDGILSYHKLIAKDLTLSASTSLGFGARQGEPYSRTILRTGLSSTLSKNIRSLKSMISTGGGINYSTSSAGGRNENLYLNLTTSSQFIRRLTALSQLRYERTKDVADVVDTIYGTTTLTEKITSDTSFSYFMNLGWRARLDLKTGLLIEEARGIAADRKFFYTDETLSYLILSNLSMRANSRYQYEAVTSFETVLFNIEFNYRIRSIFVTLKYYWRRDKEELLSTTTTHTYLEVVRPF